MNEKCSSGQTDGKAIVEIQQWKLNLRFSLVLNSHCSNKWQISSKFILLSNIFAVKPLGFNIFFSLVWSVSQLLSGSHVMSYSAERPVEAYVEIVWEVVDKEWGGSHTNTHTHIIALTHLIHRPAVLAIVHAL